MTTLWIIIGIAMVLFIIVKVFASPSRPANLPPEGTATMADVERLVRDGHKIAAIKCYREIHHVGLYEAKQAVDAIAAGRQPPQFPAQPTSSRSAAATTNMAEVENSLRSGNKIEAIKHYREINNVGLAEAKQAVEDIERKMRAGGKM